MPNTVFNVSSNRIRDIKLNPGTTVGQLRQILHGAGYDVVEATAHVDREEGGTLHGFVENYVLRGRGRSPLHHVRFGSSGC